MNYTQAVHSPQRIRGGRHGRENGIINNGSVGAIGGRSIGGIGGDGAIVSPQPEELKLFLQDMLQKMVRFASVLFLKKLSSLLCSCSCRCCCTHLVVLSSSLFYSTPLHLTFTIIYFGCA